jgi:hypothetical protein
MIKSTFRIIAIVIAFVLSFVLVVALHNANPYLLLGAAGATAFAAYKWLCTGSGVPRRVAGVLSGLLTLSALIIFFAGSNLKKERREAAAVNEQSKLALKGSNLPPAAEPKAVTSPQASNNDKRDTKKPDPPAKSPADDYMERLQEAHKIARALKYAPSELTDATPESIIILVAVFDGWAQLYERGGPYGLSPQQEAERQAFKKTLSAKQLEAFPLLRDAYGPAMRRKLWIADGKAKTFGAALKTIEFVSGSFAANRNIQAFHDKAVSVLARLRFARVQYKWVDADVEYTYYEVSAPKDSDVVTWSGSTFKVQ